tara:strand:+ start:1467 stop:1652 length:186 start_codon:yes stop_codon:yes gene_type:complete
MTTPKAILLGLTFIAVAIASILFTNQLVTPALASNQIQKVQICDAHGDCADIIANSLAIMH